MVMTEKLSAVGATAWSRFLPSVAEGVVKWRFSNCHTESRWKDEWDVRDLNCNLFGRIRRQDRKSSELVCNLAVEELLFK